MTLFRDITKRITRSKVKKQPSNDKLAHPERVENKLAELIRAHRKVRDEHQEVLAVMQMFRNESRMLRISARITTWCSITTLVVVLGWIIYTVAT